MTLLPRTRMCYKVSCCLQQIFKKLIATVQTVSKVHAAGIFHRDLKLCNIIIDRPRGSACLLDFGLAEASPTGELALAIWDWQTLVNRMLVFSQQGPFQDQK